MRTFKFPLYTHKFDKKKRKKSNYISQYVPNDLINAIKHDDLHIRGPVNLNDYVVNNLVYTIIDFWLDSLKVGIIWAPSTSRLVDIAYQIHHQLSPAEKVFASANEEIKHFFDKQAFIKNIITSKPKRKTSGKTEESVKNLFINLLKKEFVSKKNGKVLLNSQAEIIVNRLTHDMWQLIQSGEDQYEYWLSQWGLNPKEAQISFDLSFYLIKDLALEQELSSTLDFLSKVIDSRENWITDNHYSFQIDEVLGLTDNFNAFSNYFNKIFKDLKDKNIDKLIDLLNQVYPLEDEDFVRDQLAKLADRVQLLPFPKTPGVNSWADYRSKVMGSIQSWYSNYKRRREELDKQVEELKVALANTKYFFHHKSPTRDPETYDEINRQHLLKDIDFLLESCLNLLEKQDLRSNPQAHETLSRLLAELQRQVNLYFQRFYTSEKDSRDVKQVKALKDLYTTDLYKPMSFFSTVKLQENEKIVNQTFPILEAGIDYAQQVITLLYSYIDWFNSTQEKDRSVMEPSIGLRRFLHVLNQKIVDKRVNYAPFKEKLEEIILNYLSEEVSGEKLQSSKYVIFKSKYSTSNQEELSLSFEITDFAQANRQLFDELRALLSSYSSNDLLTNPQLMLDWAEISKSVVARAIRWSSLKSDEKINIDSLIPLIKPFAVAISYLDLFNIQNPTFKQFQYLTNSLIMSDFKGVATLFSKTKFKAKYTVQVVGSDKQYPLIFKLDDNQWLVAIKPSIKNRNQPDLTHVLAFNKSGAIQNKYLDFNKNQTLNIVTSRYHLQFLQNLLHKPKKWQDVQLSLSESSFIVEETYDLSWDVSSKRLTVSTPKTSKLYYALPFNFKSKHSYEQSLLKQVKNNSLDYYFIGVDVGEYGLAWLATKIEGDEIEGLEVKVKDYGFIHDPQVKKIRDRFRELQHQARLGQFTQTSQLIAEVRKNAVGRLRNHLHSYLTKFRGNLIYEANISNFETGSGRTTKIYDTVKKADTVGDWSDASRQLVKHVWGIKNPSIKKLTTPPADQLSAYASSYTCVKCGFSPYFDIKDEDKVEVQSQEGKIVTLRNLTNGKIFKGYFHKANKTQLKPILSGKDAKKLVKDFARPPLSNSESVAKFAPYLNEEKLTKRKNLRGNSSLYICPACHHITDADIQAALNLAIRGYLLHKKRSTKVSNEEIKEARKKLAEKVYQLFTQHKISLSGKSITLK